MSRLTHSLLIRTVMTKRKKHVEKIVPARVRRKIIFVGCVPIDVPVDYNRTSPRTFADVAKRRKRWAQSRRCRSFLFSVFLFLF